LKLVLRLTSEEEQQRQLEASEGFVGFLQRLAEAMAGEKREPPDQEKEETD